LSIFNPVSPVHDGAVIIKEDRVVRMAAVLPLSTRDDLPNKYGTRHRAALGLSEVSDAVVVVVSEERGEISLATDGVLKEVEDPEQLESELVDRMSPLIVDQGTGPKKVLQVFKSLFINNWPIKAGALVLVCLIWLILAGQQNFEVKLDVPVDYTGLQAGLVIGELSDREVSLDLVGPRRQASAVKRQEVKVVVNLSGQERGSHQVALIRQNIQIPLGLEVSSVSPKVLRVIIQPGAEP